MGLEKGIAANCFSGQAKDKAAAFARDDHVRATALGVAGGMTTLGTTGAATGLCAGTAVGAALGVVPASWMLSGPCHPHSPLPLLVPGSGCGRNAAVVPIGWARARGCRDTERESSNEVYMT